MPSSPPPVRPASDGRQRDVALGVMAWGNAVLAIPGALATALLAYLGFLMLSTPSYLAAFVAASVGIGIGYALLLGYWRVRSGRMPIERHAQFWALSTAHNGLLAAALVAWLMWVLDEFPSSGDGALYGVLASGVALLSWTVWMTASGARRASAISQRPTP